MAETLLKVNNLQTYFSKNNKKIKAVDGVDFEVDKGKILCIVGESGSGKSITSLSIMGLVQNIKGSSVEGTILFEGQDLLNLTDLQLSDLRGNEIGMIFQEPMTALNPIFSIGHQIIEVLRRHKKIPKKEARLIAIKQLKEVGIPRAEEIMNEYPHQISGGMRQRVMIAMMMACEPKLLIADEPTTALDVTIQAQVLELMRRLKDEKGTAIILITHDLGVVAEMADTIAVMYAGQIVESGPADEVFENPLHPYTQALKAAIPIMDEQQERLIDIPGTVPNAANFPAGCRFADRCSRTSTNCYRIMPKYREINSGHFIRCDLV